MGFIRTAISSPWFWAAVIGTLAIGTFALLMNRRSTQAQATPSIVGTSAGIAAAAGAQSVTPIQQVLNFYGDITEVNKDMIAALAYQGAVEAITTVKKEESDNALELAQRQARVEEE